MIIWIVFFLEVVDVETALADDLDERRQIARRIHAEVEVETDLHAHPTAHVEGRGRRGSPLP